MAVEVWHLLRSPLSERPSPPSWSAYHWRLPVYWPGGHLPGRSTLPSSGGHLAHLALGPRIQQGQLVEEAFWDRARTRMRTLGLLGSLLAARLRRIALATAAASTAP
jgi:hypothetical protein